MYCGAPVPDELKLSGIQKEVLRRNKEARYQELERDYEKIARTKHWQPRSFFNYGSRPQHNVVSVEKTRQRQPQKRSLCV